MCESCMFVASCDSSTIPISARKEGSPGAIRNLIQNLTVGQPLRRFHNLVHNPTFWRVCSSPEMNQMNQLLDFFFIPSIFIMKSWQVQHFSAMFEAATLRISRSRIISANLGGQRGTTNVTFSSVLASINLLRWMSGWYWNHTYQVNQWDWRALWPAKWIPELLFWLSLSYQMIAALFVYIYIQIHYQNELWPHRTFTYIYCLHHKELLLSPCFSFRLFSKPGS